MAEYFDEGAASAPDAGTGGANPAALNAAMAGPSAVTEEARAFLREQEALTKLQAKILHEEHALELSHLKWRRYNDWMRSGWQTGLAALCAVAVAVIATTLWDASRANGLVVDAFTVPPDFEQRGMGGDVIAADMTSRLAAIRQVAVNISYSNTSDVSQNRANAIQVEIPETGISIGEAWRYLRGWLGHERHLAGSLRELADGRITLSASLDGAAAFVAIGKPSDVAALERKVAEGTFESFDPVNHVNYLSTTGRSREAMEAAARFASIARGLYHADAYALWSYTTAFATGDIQIALTRARIGESIDPQLAVPHVMAARMNFFLGRSEEQFDEDRKILSLRNEDQLPAHQGGGFQEMQAQARAQIALLGGDYANAPIWSCSHSCVYAGLLISDSIFAARLHDVGDARALLERGLAAGGEHLADVNEARYWIDAAEENWRAALGDTSGLRLTYAGRYGNLNPRFDATTDATYAMPLIALAQAHLGHFAQAHALIDQTSADCVPCETARGKIDALEKHWGGMAFWFARANRDAPSVPFADADWGEMLLRAGKYDDAIEKFAAAHKRGPHFADPIEMWGEALMQENRSDLALAKFEEADKYTPHWGRLHLEWGEALFYAGKEDEAQKQFATASGLDLAATERATLARWKGHSWKSSHRNA